MHCFIWKKQVLAPQYLLINTGKCRSESPPTCHQQTEDIIVPAQSAQCMGMQIHAPQLTLGMLVIWLGKLITLAAEYSKHLNGADHMGEAEEGTFCLLPICHCNNDD